jgi:hypothetical protein
MGSAQSAPKQARKIIEGLGLDVAMPDDAREIRSPKGGDKVAFQVSDLRSRPRSNVIGRVRFVLTSGGQSRLKLRNSGGLLGRKAF